MRRNEGDGMVERLEMDVAGRQLTIESGRVAKQADGAVLVQMADTVVLVTAVTAKTPRAGVDFPPLTVDYQERAYAAGKIPGGFFKREGRPAEREILSGRLIDRPLRPLFPKRFYHETQVIASVLRSENSRRVFQARGTPSRAGDSLRPSDRSAVAAALPEAVLPRDPGHRVGPPI